MDLLSDLFAAYYDARRHKRNTINQLRFEMDLEENLISLYHEIRLRRYEPRRCVCFIIEQPVKREIFAADFRDRVVHHLLFNYINGYVEKQLIYDSYSCRKGKGTLFGIERLEHHIRSCSHNYGKPCYVLKLDLQGYFMGINRERLLTETHRILAPYMDTKTKTGEYWRDTDNYALIYYLLEVIILNDPIPNCFRKGKLEDWDGLPPSKSLFHSPKGCGIPIGNLTSQLFSNIYLNGFDWYVKRTLKVKHYGRYVDDFYLLHNDKQKLIRLKGLIQTWLKENLGLTIHPKKVYLQQVEHGVSFLGAVVKPYRRYASNRSVQNFHRALNKIETRLQAGEPGLEELTQIRATVNSYMGYLTHFKAYNIKKKLVFDKELSIYKYGYLTKNKMKLINRKSVQTRVTER